MIPGAVHRSPDIFLTAEENLGISQLGNRLMKGLCDQSTPKMGSLTSKRGVHNLLVINRQIIRTDTAYL